MTTQRPWGYYRILLDEEYTKVKELVVKPGMRLSYQYHYKREELWTVVKGTATVVIDDVEKVLTVGQYVFVPLKCKHRICNYHSDELKIIEVQTGTYFGEDDIVRIDDDFNRV